MKALTFIPAGIFLLAACGGASQPASSPSAPTKTAASPASTGAAAAAKPSGAPASGLTKVRFRYPVVTGAWVPFMVGKDAGIYEKHGLDVDVQMLSGSLQVPSIINGESDVSGTSAETVVAANASGAPVVMIGAMIPEAMGFLFVTPDVKQVADLKGKSVVVTAFGNVGEFGLRRALATANLQLGKDVAVHAVQTTPGEIAALVSGAAEGFMAYPPDDVQAKRANPGFHSIYDVRDLKLPYVQASLFVNRSYLNANRATLVKFMQATSEGLAYEKKEPDFAVKTFQKYGKVQDLEVAQRAITFFPSVLSPNLAVNPQALKIVIDVVATQTPAVANLDPAKVLDTSITDELPKA